MALPSDFRTRAQLLDLARQQGFAGKALGATFDHYQKCGLLGLGMQKTGRRNERLWHPAQAELWLTLLRHRPLDVHQAVLANFPVGIWLLNWEGVAREQAQRALRYFAKDVGRPGKGVNQADGRPDGPGSYRDRGFREAIDRLVAPTASAAAKRAFRDQFTTIADSLPDLTVPDSLAASVLQALSPEMAPAANVQQYAALVPRMLRLRYLAVQHIDALTTDCGDICQFWEWARREHTRASIQVQQVVPALRTTNTNIGWLYKQEMDLQWFFERACGLLLQVLGYGIDALSNGTLPPETVARIPDIRRWLS